MKRHYPSGLLDRRDKLQAYEKQNHKCNLCGEEFKFDEMHGDHIIAWSKRW